MIEEKQFIFVKFQEREIYEKTTKEKLDNAEYFKNEGI